MRARITILVVLPALVIVASALVLRSHWAKSGAPVTAMEPASTASGLVAATNDLNTTEAKPAKVPVEVAMALSSPPPPQSTNLHVLPQTDAPALTAEEQEKLIETETERLQDLSMSDNPTSLPPILAGLTNTVKEIRQAAIEATIQFGSPDAIPALKAAAVATTDPQEKEDLLDAADFLALPSLTDFVKSLPPRNPDAVQADQQLINEREKRNAQKYPGSPAPTEQEQTLPQSQGN